MTDTTDNILPFRPRPVPSEGSYCVPEDARGLVSLCTDTSAGFTSLVVLPPPAGVTAWEIQDPEQIDMLAVHLIQLALRIRLKQGGPP